MNIFCFIEKNSWIEQHIVEFLRNDGHFVFCHYHEFVGKFYGGKMRFELINKNAQLLNNINHCYHQTGIDLIFCYVYDDFLLPESARALADLNVPMVNYNVDMVNQWYRQIRTAKYFTKILCAQRSNMEQMARYNPDVLYWPMAGITSCPSKGESFRPFAPVTFVGTPTPYRKEILARLHSSGVPLAIYGKYWQENRVATTQHCLEKTLKDLRYYAWPKFRAGGMEELYSTLKARLFPERHASSHSLPPNILGGFVPNDAMSSLFAHSMINIGFTRMSEGPADKPGKTQLKLRDFEVPLAGGFYLVERVPEYEEHFRTGIEVETWTTFEELHDKIVYYLKNPEIRARIAAAGQRRAEERHTWKSRFQVLFKELGLN